MANKTFSFELQQFDCRLPSVEAAAWGKSKSSKTGVEAQLTGIQSYLSHRAT